MSIKSFAAKIYAKSVVKRIHKWAEKPVETQRRVFAGLIKKARYTDFGKAHSFDQIRSPQDFARLVPVRDYEGLRPYIDEVVNGKENVLWPGRPLYYAKTAGTTSGPKYIPLTKESMPTHINGAKHAILNYIAETGKSDFVDGKMIFLQGSPVLQKTNGVPTGRLSGIVAHFVPSYLQKNRLPSWETNCIEDWEEKSGAIIKETLPEDMTVISGIPSWVEMYFKQLQEKTGKSIKNIFPNFNLFIYGGVNFEPYRKTFEKLIGKNIPSIELFPASEGFFAFQDKPGRRGMLLRLDSGIFYEFIEVGAYFDENPKRLTLGEVECGVDYVMIISTNAGLWAYNLGDTVQFTSLNPFRVIVSGRLKHFISAFGEHVIGKEVETALQEVLKQTQARINEFTVAPQVNPDAGLPYHEWFIEFDRGPGDMEYFRGMLDKALCQQNSYYDDLIEGKILCKLKISRVPKGGFQAYMHSIGKLGGQNKIPHLANNRDIVKKLKTIE